MPEFILPDWPAPPGVRALSTLRQGGVSQGPYASLNLGDHVGDDPAAVAANRHILAQRVPTPTWLCQVHGTRVVAVGEASSGCEADAVFSRAPGTVLRGDDRRLPAPALLRNRQGNVVAAAHAGWRGLVRWGD